MERKLELAFFFIAIAGLLVCRSPLFLLGSITWGMLGTSIFALAVMGLFSDDIKGFFDLAPQ